LRIALADGEGDLPAHNIRGACIILGGVTQESNQIARSGVADSEHQRIFGRVHELVEVGRVESVLETNLARVGRAVESSLGAIGKRPVAAADRDNLTAFRCAAGVAKLSVTVLPPAL